MTCEPKNLPETNNKIIPGNIVEHIGLLWSVSSTFKDSLKLRRIDGPHEKLVYANTVVPVSVDRLRALAISGVDWAAKALAATAVAGAPSQPE